VILRQVAMDLVKAFETRWDETKSFVDSERKTLSLALEKDRDDMTNQRGAITDEITVMRQKNKDANEGERGRVGEG
jgi:hypothetical protein